MKIHAFRHVAYEGLGLIKEWIDENEIEFSETLAYADPKYPDTDSYDGLIIMGGPMSVHDEEEFPWLIKEKELIRKSIDEGKKVLGICLGSQLVAESLGSKVYRNSQSEIGWFPIKKTFLFHSWFTAFDDKAEETVLHWHNDTFDLPDGAVRLFSSQCCNNQAFQLEDNVLALQFHLEMTPEIIRAILEKSSDSLIPKQYVQNPEKIIKGSLLHEEKAREMLFDLLSCFFLEE